ncbi:hypothetical protein CEXT_774771 [Caerostris extrusa]|uniref:Uncharacterized protein n=1 Tax=Caerostris extrusa TaxID=172846 RepID=A0AAV4VMJ3_CAEEX|nr:hypothetical protein CEXT_774771 [Caerostris extrusa]
MLPSILEGKTGGSSWCAVFHPCHPLTLRINRMGGIIITSSGLVSSAKWAYRVAFFPVITKLQAICMDFVCAAWYPL